MLFTCRDCGDSIREHFSNTGLKQRLCRTHINARKRRHRTADVARNAGFSLQDARRVLQAFQNRSILSGKSDDVTIVRIDRDKPLTVTNAMVIDVREPRVVPEEVRERAKTCQAGMWTGMALPGPHRAHNPTPLGK